MLAASSAKLKVYAANTIKNCATASASGRQAVEASGAVLHLVKQLGHKWYTHAMNRYVQVFGSIVLWTLPGLILVVLVT